MHQAFRKQWVGEVLRLGWGSITGCSVSPAAGGWRINGRGVVCFSPEDGW